jgi:hypothetical protein
VAAAPYNTVWVVVPLRLPPAPARKVTVNDCWVKLAVIVRFWVTFVTVSGLALVVLKPAPDQFVKV